MAGLQRYGSIYVRSSPTGRSDWPLKFECRAVVVMFGNLGIFNGVLDPFDPKFHGNYVRGVGMTPAIAIHKAKERFDQLEKELWV